MLNACRGPDLRDRRDEALMGLVFTTGARAGEVVAMEPNEEPNGLNLRAGPPTVIIRCGKGGKGRVSPLAVEAAAAIDDTRLGGRPLVPRRSGMVSWRRLAADAIEVVIAGSGHLSRPGRLNPIHGRRLALIPVSVVDASARSFTAAAATSA